ncbi:uncharacterized protein ACVW00_001572 [Marmoricola sp. URHA0025 HA25]
MSTTPSRTVRTPATPVHPFHGRLTPLGLDEVSILGGFWGSRQSVNADATLPHIESWLEREGWIGNFDLAAEGLLPRGRRGREFSDSEVYKFLEAMAWEIGRSGRSELEERFRSTVARIAAAQEADGYLNTMFGRPGQAPRWSDLEFGHELYCLGHLFQAAVARLRTRPAADDGLVAVAIRAADHVCEVFGEGARDGICGHPEIELGLVELGRATGDQRYVRQAELFIRRRGHGTLGPVEYGSAYFQDDVPVRDATVLRGHVVRAGYLSAAAVDVAVEDGDQGLLDALRTQWRATRDRRTYITGGQGSHHLDEAFGDDYELPPDRAYNETCASIASVMFSWRLLLASGDPTYADLVERTLFNNVAASPAEDGRSFFYTNTLHKRTPGEPAPTDRPHLRAQSSMRAPWFAVSCCPPNVARTFASLAAYVATRDAEGLQIHQYAPSTIRTRLDDGTSVEVDVRTSYPASGTIAVEVVTSAEREWTLSLRVPEWAESGARLVETDDGGARHVSQVAPGVVDVRRRFRAGDVVVLELPMQPRAVRPDPRIDALRGCVAVERGPEVMCLESVDLPGGPEGVQPDVGTASIDLSAGLGVDGEAVTARIATEPPPPTRWPYLTDGEEPEGVAPGRSSSVRLVPYHHWGNRGPSTMRVWIPEDADTWS